MKTKNILTKEVCSTCPRHCNKNRNLQEGFCCETNSIRIAKIIKNFQWEEPCITGTKGSLAIFFSGCNLRCDYCQNYEISRGKTGEIFTIDEFCKLIEENQDEHSTIDLITPTHFSNQLEKAFQKINKKIPIVWNTNSYENLENLNKINKFVDIFLADFKYADNELGKKFSVCSDYYSVCLNALKEMCKLKTDKYENELMTEGVIIRHLVLPNYTQNSLKVLTDIKKYFPERKISLMSQFTPNGKSSLDRKIKPIEYKIVLQTLQTLNLNNGYIQEFESADSCFVPKFV